MEVQTYYDKLDRLIVLYMGSGMPSFDNHVNTNSSEHWGENTFCLFYAINNKLGLSDIEPVRPNHDFNVSVINNAKYDTNIYTVIYPFYKDFGYVGIVIFAIITGLLFGYIFKMAQQGDMFGLCLYALFAICLIMEFMDDIFYTTLSQYIQYFLIGIIPFFISKYHLFEKQSDERWYFNGDL